MGRVIPGEPDETVPPKLADIVRRRRLWPSRVDIFEALVDFVDLDCGTVALAARHLGMSRQTLYNRYWTPYRERYQAGVTIEQLRSEEKEGR